MHKAITRSFTKYSELDSSSSLLAIRKWFPYMQNVQPQLEQIPPSPLAKVPRICDLRDKYFPD